MEPELDSHFVVLVDQDGRRQSPFGQFGGFAIGKHYELRTMPVVFFLSPPDVLDHILAIRAGQRKKEHQAPFTEQVGLANIIAGEVLKGKVGYLLSDLRIAGLDEVRAKINMLPAKVGLAKFVYQLADRLIACGGVACDVSVGIDEDRRLTLSALSATLPRLM